MPRQSKLPPSIKKRWRVERLFQVLDQCFRGEIDTLAYPRAALFGFLYGPDLLQRPGRSQSSNALCSWR